MTSLGTAGYVWLSNYRQLRTSLLLGLVGFAVVLAVHDPEAVHSFFRWGSLYADSTLAKQFFVGLQGVWLLALASPNYSPCGEASARCVTGALNSPTLDRPPWQRRRASTRTSG